ncbi:MAG: hypothetical protein KC621_27365 [Myxococcales bacterium]|nr:hypothetical protein [Myxococcales bacterium]
MDDLDVVRRGPLLGLRWLEWKRRANAVGRVRLASVALEFVPELVVTALQARPGSPDHAERFPLPDLAAVDAWVDAVSSWLEYPGATTREALRAAAPAWSDIGRVPGRGREALRALLAFTELTTTGPLSPSLGSFMNHASVAGCGQERLVEAFGALLFPTDHG